MNNNLIPTESQEAMAFVEWASYANMSIMGKTDLIGNVIDYLIHIPNEGKRSTVSGLHLRKQGLKKGVSDYLFAYPYKGSAGLWIELKSMKGHLTDSQQEWLVKMRKVGYEAFVAFGSNDAIRIVKEYLRKV